MSTDLYVALSGALAHLEELDLVANNLANADTVGYKRDRPTFVAALESALQGLDGRVAPGASGSVFVASSGPVADFTGGSVEQTGAALDVAIQGEGLFSVQTPGGTRYTRAGSFTVSSAGLLTTPAGHPVLGDGGPIELGTRAAEIRSSGQVVDAEGSELGRLQLVSFEDPGALRKEGQNLLRAPADAAARPIDDPALVERSVERSNVQPVQELAHLVVLQRSFDVVMQMLRADNEAREQLIREVSS